MSSFSKIELPKSIKNISLLKKNLNIVFMLLLVLLFLAEFWVMKGSVSLFLSFNNQPVSVSHNREVRVNFQDYDKIVDRIQNAKYFTAQENVTDNPFKPGK